MDHAALIEILDRDGQVRETHKVRAWPLRIGRAPDCDLVLADPHLAGHHALLHASAPDPASGTASPAVRLELLPGINGGWLDQQHLAPGTQADWPAAGAVLQLGTTRLRLRRQDDPLAPEKPLPRGSEPAPAVRRPAWLLPGLVGASALVLWGDFWSGSEAQSSWVDAASAVLAPLGVVLVWAVLWALVTQLFRHTFAFSAHLVRTLAVLLGVQVVTELAMPLLAYALSWPRLMAVEGVGASLALVGLLWWQASLVWPRARRQLALGLGLLFLVGLALMLGRRTEQQHWLGQPYSASLPPPAVRLVSPQPVEAFVDGLQSLQEPLQRQSRKRNEQAGGSGDNEE